MLIKRKGRNKGRGGCNYRGICFIPLLGVCVCRREREKKKSERDRKKWRERGMKNTLTREIERKR